MGLMKRILAQYGNRRVPVGGGSSDFQFRGRTYYETINLDGLKEIQTALDALPRELITKKFIGAAYRKGAVILRRTAQSILRSKVKGGNRQTKYQVYQDYSRTKGAFLRIKKHAPGNLAKSIGWGWHDKHVGYGNLPAYYVGPKRGFKAKYDGWYAHFVEWGTSGYVTKKGFYLNGRWIPRGTVMRGQQAKPFMRPAWDREQNRVIKAITDELLKAII